MAPGLAWLICTARHASEWGIKPGSPITIAYERELENAVETMKRMHRRGIKVLIGGDYGLAWTPQGTNAKDLEYFVNLVGFSPMEAIVAATKYGGQIMGMGGRARPDQGRLSGGSAAGRRRSPGRRADPSGQEPPACHHEGRQVPQGAGSAPGQCAARSLKQGPRNTDALVPPDIAERHHPRGPLLYRGERFHADLRADAECQSGARIVVSARRLPRLRGHCARRIPGCSGSSSRFSPWPSLASPCRS